MAEGAGWPVEFLQTQPAPDPQNSFTVLVEGGKPVVRQTGSVPAVVFVGHEGVSIVAMEAAPRGNPDEAGPVLENAADMRRGTLIKGESRESEVVLLRVDRCLPVRQAPATAGATLSAGAPLVRTGRLT